MRKSKKSYSLKHNNTITSNNIDLYYNGKTRNALKYIQEYNKKYPKDIKGKFIEGKFLRLNKEPELAKEILEISLSMVSPTSEFYIKILLELIFTEIDLKNYAKALEYYYMYIDAYEIKDSYFDLSLIRIFLLKKLGNYQSPISIEEYDYNERQIVDFSEEECFNNINNRIYFEEQNDSKRSKYFYENIDFKNLYFKLEKLLPYAMESIGYSVYKCYIFKTPIIGFDDIGELNHVQILAIEIDGNLKIANLIPYRPRSFKGYINNMNALEIEYLINQESSNRKLQVS